MRIHLCYPGCPWLVTIRTVRGSIRSAARPSDRRARRGAPGGSRRAPRRRPSRHAASAIEIASVGGRPKSSVATKLARADRDREADDTPIATRIIDSRITSRSTSCRCAPSAMRMPISFVRRDTLYDISPNSPIDGEQQREPAEQRVGLREQLLLREAPLDLLDLRRHVRQRQVRIDLPARPRGPRP